MEMTGIGTDASEFWRNVFFALASGWILLSFLRGWRQGVLRQLLVPLAVLGASAVAVLVAPTGSALQSIWVNPRIRALQADPEILEPVRRGDFLSVLSNPKVIALWTDPGIRALWSGNEIQAACDYAKEEASR
jgi:hypothetical protein